MRLLIPLFLICAGYARQSAYTGKPFPTTAVLNNANWYGTPQAVKSRVQPGDPGTTDKFMLLVRTDLPYKTSARLRVGFESPTGCESECLPIQMLLVENIPLKKGKYRLARLDKCGTLSPDKAHHSLLLPRTGSGVVQAYRQKGKAKNWLRVTRYDPVTNGVEGRFALTLEAIPTEKSSQDSTQNQMVFRDGRFRAVLTNVLKLEGTKSDKEL
jgi:hypothetical protein